MRAFTATPPIRRTAALLGGASWSPLDISENARVFTSDSGVASSGSDTVYSWCRKRDDRPWGDWIGRDSAFTYVENGKPYMYGGWSNGNVTDWGNTFLTNEVWTSDDEGINWYRILADDPSTTTRPSKRHLAARCYATFDSVDYVYMMGGKLDVSGGPQTPQTVDVWRKPLGDPNAAWEQMTSNAGVGARDNMFMGFLDGILYAGGGYTGVGNSVGPSLGVQQDLWKSEDEGATWTLVTATAPWGPSAACGQELLTRDGKLWKFGGWVSTDGFAVVTATNDVWTYDGTSFDEVLADGHAQWEQRFYHNVALFDGEFYVITGHNDGPGNHGDVFRSTDGVTWTQLPAITFENTHAMSVWVLSDHILTCNGYRVTYAGASYGTIFDYAVNSLYKHSSCPRVDSWTGGGLTLTASSTARPYLVTGALASGKKTIYFDLAQYMTLASQDALSSPCSIMIAGKFPHMHATTKQSIVSSTDDVSVGVVGIGTFVSDSSSDTAMPRFHPNEIQRGDLRTMCFTMDGSAIRQWIDTDEIDSEGESFSIASSGWSKVGGGYTSTADNLRGHIVAIAVIPDTAITQENVESFRTWALSKAGVTESADSYLTTLAPAQLLLRDDKPAHYLDAANRHLLKDYSVDFRSGSAIHGFAPQPCLTNSVNAPVALSFGSYRPGKTDGPIIIEFSMKTAATITARGIAACQNTTLGGLDYQWMITQTVAGKLVFHQRSLASVVLTSAATLSPSTWYRVKFERTGSSGNWTVNLYLNGVLDSTATTSTDPGTLSATTTSSRLFDTFGSPPRFDGSLADVRMTHDGHKYFMPLNEGARFVLNMIRSDGVIARQSVIIDTAQWGNFTEPASMCPNWLLNYGGTIELGQTSIIPGNFDGITTADTNADNFKSTIYPSRLYQGTINCDPTSVGAGGLGLESALTRSTDRVGTSSGKRRMRVVGGHCTRLAARLTAMNSSADNDYFLD